MHFLLNCPQVNAPGSHWWKVNINSATGLVLSGHKTITWTNVDKDPFHLMVSQTTQWMNMIWHTSSDTGGIYRSYLDSSPPEQNGRHFADDFFRCIFVNENFCILINSSLNFVPKGPIDNHPALVQIMAWRWIGDKPLSEPMLTW